ncbi:hypothetical protein M2271_000221 [Streptomyces sp. LBL]|uniref:hypothetical protein n=1 Tax=Streptomyces sp. LBL TaxID=2940562 RepID=UPI0024758B63|nr:hypothetical protein [Streptomyces sp. LBL]MDH6622434.1 hypothetical protein [Streptomyces sp. LBL]
MAVGALFQVSIGFGLGLSAAPVIAIVDPSLTPVVVVVLLAIGVTATVLMLDGGHADLRGAGWALVGLTTWGGPSLGTGPAELCGRASHMVGGVRCTSGTQPP